MTSKPASPAVEGFLSFVQASPSPFHAVASSVAALRAAGFQEIRERHAWSLVAANSDSGSGAGAGNQQQQQLRVGGRYYFTRNKSALVAFTIGGRWEGASATSGTQPGAITVIGAHTDSPCLKVKPRSARSPKGGCVQVGMETYGGGLWGTWFDRDLSLAGRVMVDTSAPAAASKETGKESPFQHRLVHLRQPLLRIPTLAIHLDRGAGDNFTFNKETHLTPVLALLAETDPLLGGTAVATASPSPPGKGAGAVPNAGNARHSPVLLDLLGRELGVAPTAIGDFELCAYDTQPPAVGGANGEFLYSARLDNLMMSYCSLQALLAFAAHPEAVETSANLQMITLFDNEEVGSQSAYGADSNLLEVTLQRLCALSPAGASGPAPSESEALARVMARSLLLSADMAHGTHPNYPEKHEDAHRPLLNGGVVIKQNANQRYATTALTTHLLRQLARHAGVPVQEFVVRNDSPCGSTIGPMLSAKLGLPTVDLGIAQWSMHSIRECCGTRDVGAAIELFTTLFTHYSRVRDALDLDE